MNKRNFIDEFLRHLKSLPAEEKEDIIQDFEEYFEVGQLEGKSEEEIAQSLGAPQKLAKDLHANYYVEKAKEDHSAGNIARAIWAVIGLSFLNLILVLGPFLAIAGVILSLWIIAASFIVQIVAALFKSLFRPELFHFFELFMSVTISGIGLLLLLVVYPITQYAVKLFVKYLSFNIRIVKGGATYE